MLNDATQPDADSVPPPQKGKSRKWLIVGAAATLLALGGGGGGAYYFMAGKPAADNTKDAQKSPPKSAEKVPHKTMLYVPMESFTVNLQNSDQERYLQVTINLEVADTATANSLKEQMPSVRNAVLLLLSSKDARDLMTRDGKEKLSTEITTELRKKLDGAGPSKGLEQILFSHFVIQ